MGTKDGHLCWIICVIGWSLIIETDGKLYNYGLEAGDTQITSFPQPSTLDLIHSIRYLGKSYNRIYISEYGVVGFHSEISFLKQEWRSNPEEGNYPFVAPYYFETARKTANVPGKIFYRNITGNGATLNDLGEYLETAVVGVAVKGFTPDLAVIVTWENVTDVRSSTNDCLDEENINICDKTNTFQLVIVACQEQTFLIFNYHKMDVPAREFYQAGMNGGLNVGWKDVYCESNCISTQNVSVFPDIMASDMKGRFIYKVSDDVIIRGGCLPSDDGQLEVSPQYVSAFGGHIVDVSGVCVTNTSKVTCKFGASDPVEAVYASPMFVRCLTPRLTARDLVTLKITIDDSTVLHKDIHAVLPFQSTQLDHIVLSLGWDKTDVRKLNLTWDYKVFPNNPAATVDILLIGYRETETQMIFKILATLGTNVKISDGVFEFDTSDHRCSGEDCKLFEQGMVEVRLNTKYWTPATKYGFIGSGIFPIGWHVVEYMKSTHGADWSKVLCTNWYDTDRQEMTWLEELLDCPCTLDQALTDFGRWLTDGGCNIFNGSVCTYHIGAVHCVRSFKPSKSGAGNQCCYGPDGNVRYAADSFQGSTPDRGHDWGAPPYNKPGYVPSLSHWKHDVVTFYYCCLWVDYKYCDNYMDQRATRDCKNYQPPKTAIIYGGLHVRTFANIAYVAVGIGDYWLTKTTDFQLQGRFDQIKGTLVFSTALVGVVLQGTNSSKVEIQLAPSTYTSQRVLTILVDQQITWFNTLERSRQDLKGLTIINYESQAGKHDNFTIIMTNGIGVQVVAVNNLLHTTVVVPQAYKDQTEGLFGTWSYIEMDGVKNRNGQLIPIQTSSTQHIYENLITSWSVNATERLFQYPTMQNPSFAPLFSFPLLPINITEDEINELCGSEMPNSSCHYDYRATGSSDIANATLQAETWFKTVQSFQVPVESCGLLDVPRSIKNSYNYGIGSKINIDGCRKGYLTGETTSYTCTRKGNNTNVWEPEISAMCKAPTQPPPCPSGPTGAGSSPKITSILAIFIFMCYLVS